jgi:hypothetical protein
MQKTPGYVIISLVFFILIGVGFAYSYFFYPNDQPIECVVKAYTGHDCPTCGFSRAFSYYTHLQFQEGKSYNTLSGNVFLFFFFQFLFRGIVVISYLIRRRSFNTIIIKSDLLISISFFLLAFLPIILNYLNHGK